MDLQEVTKLARTLMDKYELDGWIIRTVKSKSFAGRCIKHIGYSDLGMIELSIDYMEVFDVAEATETILHEIAHALNDPKNKAHGPEWKAIARSIGSTGERCVSREAPRPESKWTGVCSGGHEFYRNRLTSRVRFGVYCTKCSTGDKKAYVKWYETENYKKFEKTAPELPVAQNFPTAAQNAPLSWKEKYDRGMTEIDW